MTTTGMTLKKAVEFLEEAARYFEKRPMNGEDSAFWSNVTNARNCREIALILSHAMTPEEWREGEPMTQRTQAMVCDARSASKTGDTGMNKDG